jgi:hypothetical protein
MKFRELDLISSKKGKEEIYSISAAIENLTLYGIFCYLISLKFMLKYIFMLG